MAGDFGYPFRQARWYEQGRGGYDCIWIVWHATDDDEAPTYAEGLGNYFATTDRRVSTHAGVDSNSVMEYVRLADTAFGAGSPANYRGYHIEHSGRSTQTREQWLDEFGGSLFDQSAELNARVHRRTGIPFRGRFLTDDELRRRVPGTTRHMDLVRVFGGTHDRCPSPNFPADVLFDRIAKKLNGDNDMDMNTPLDGGAPSYGMRFADYCEATLRGANAAQDAQAAAQAGNGKLDELLAGQAQTNALLVEIRDALQAHTAPPPEA